jgi:hypothetical protein
MLWETLTQVNEFLISEKDLIICDISIFLNIVFYPTYGFSVGAAEIDFNYVFARFVIEKILTGSD